MAYIHPDDPEILDFAAEMARDGAELESLCRKLLAWFEGHVAYSRLHAPLCPLQRSDLEVLHWKSGTCGDYANLVVSLLLALGFDARYAWVKRDCYGDAQDHICAAVRQGDRELLVDPTPPYRRWFGFDCPHMEYELLSPEVFSHRIAREEAYWKQRAADAGKPLASGLLYAPWIHSEPVYADAEHEDRVFFLLALNRALEPTLYAYYQRYTIHGGRMLAMTARSKGETRLYISNGLQKEFWDDTQWRAKPDGYDSPEVSTLRACLSHYIGRIDEILRRAGCSGLME